MVCQGYDQSSLLLQPWRRVYEVSRRMADKGVSITIVSDGNSSQPQKENIGRIPIVRVEHLALALLTRKKELLETILNSTPDIVIWYGTPLSAIYLTKLKSLQTPLIWDIDTGLNTLKIFRQVSLREILDLNHNLLLDQTMSAVCPRFVIRSTANSSLVSKIIVSGQYLKTALCRIGVDPAKIEVIPLSMGPHKLDMPSTCEKTEEERNVFGFETRFTVTYLGSPCTLRGTDTLIRSFKKILQKHDNTRLVILSRRALGMPSRERDHLSIEEICLKRLVQRLHLECNVEIISGTLDKSTLEQYVLASDVIALPFKLIFSEPPLSLLEAMSYGKAVVTTNLGILPEIIGNNRGILTKPGDPNSLAEAILFLKENQKESVNIGKNANRFVSGLPDWDGVALQLIRLLDEVTEKSA
jgi:phosphatidylinositol alpha-1,6-mannosyltransferase